MIHEVAAYARKSDNYPRIDLLCSFLRGNMPPTIESLTKGGDGEMNHILGGRPKEPFTGPVLGE